MKKIYTKTGNYHSYFEVPRFSKITEDQTYDLESIFWHDQHDFTRSNVQFDECLYESAWEHLKNDPTSKILLFYGDEYYNILDLRIWAKTLKDRGIKPNQLYIICVDDNWTSWTKREMSKLGAEGVNVQSLTLLMDRVSPQTPKPITHRFSAFSRNYLKWRLKLFVKLFNLGLLKYFTYTFNNIMPYGKVITYDPKEIKNHAVELGFTIDKNLLSWIKAIPYKPKGDNYMHKLSSSIYDKLSSSGIHLVIESHFDPFWQFAGSRDKEDFRQFSPAFPTEKTYKAIGCNRPFIIASTPEFLKEFRQLGYKTFHPYIDETYDTIEDDELRMQAIVNEIERLAKLTTDEFNSLILECEKIAKHNASVMAEKKKEIVFTKEFEWVIPLVGPTARHY